MKSLMGFPPCGIFDKVEGVPPTVRNIDGFARGVAVGGLVLTSPT
jgi:hypothetical protein